VWAIPTVCKTVLFRMGPPLTYVAPAIGPWPQLTWLLVIFWQNPIATGL